MGAPTSGDFEFAKARIIAAGELILTGTAWLPEGDVAAAPSFVVVGRRTQTETRYPAECSGSRQPLEVTGRLPLHALDLEGETFADVYFESDGSGMQTRTRVEWHPRARWIPYPTKLGNLSLRRWES